MIENSYTSLICLMITFAKGCRALECWTCSSMYEPGCNDPFKPNDLTKDIQYFLHDCNQDAVMNGSLEEQLLIKHIFGHEAKMYCRKTILKFYGITIVHRGCSFGVIREDCSDGRKDVVCDTAACFTDGCNASTCLSWIFSLCIFTTIYTTKLIFSSN